MLAHREKLDMGEAQVADVGGQLLGEFRGRSAIIVALAPP